MTDETQTEAVQQPDAAAFLARAGAFLGREEATHNLLLGLAGELAHNAQLFGAAPPLFVTLERGGEVVGAALRTPPHPLQISLLAPGAAGALAALADLLERADPDLPVATGPAPVADEFSALWAARRSLTRRRTLALRIYQLTAVRPPAGVAGRLRRAGLGDLELVTEWNRGFHRDAFGEDESPERARAAAERWLTAPGRELHLWEVDGRPVSSAGAGGATPRGVRISAVYTPPELRGRGYASACVAALSQLQLDSGRGLCFLYTDLANPTSNSIYRRIGYEPVCDVDEFAFARQG